MQQVLSSLESDMSKEINKSKSGNLMSATAISEDKSLEVCFKNSYKSR